MSTIRLRRTREADVDFVVAAEQLPAARRFVLAWSADRHLAALADADVGHFIIEHAADDRAVGFVLLAGLLQRDANVELRRIVVTEPGHGYGRAALRAVIELAFAEVKAHRLWLDVMADNERARRLYRAEGFRQEGVLRECVRAEDGSYRSLVVFSLLDHEYRPA